MEATRVQFPQALPVRILGHQDPGIGDDCAGPSKRELDLQAPFTGLSDETLQPPHLARGRSEVRHFLKRPTTDKG